MKNNNNTVTVNSSSPSVSDIVKAAREANQSGSIQIDELEKKLNIGRGEIIRQIRALGVGTFLKVGRRGKPSVLLFGQLADDFLANKVKQSPKLSRVKSKIEYLFKISMGGQEKTIPLHFELEPV